MSRRILVLVHETLVPPDSTEGYSEQEIDEWRTEYDVSTSLRQSGHEVRVLGMVRDAAQGWDGTDPLRRVNLV